MKPGAVTMKPGAVQIKSMAAKLKPGAATTKPGTTTKKVGGSYSESSCSHNKAWDSPNKAWGSYNKNRGSHNKSFGSIVCMFDIRVVSVERSFYSSRDFLSLLQNAMGMNAGVVKHLQLAFHGTAEIPAHLRKTGGRRDYGDITEQLRAVKVRGAIHLSV